VSGAEFYNTVTDMNLFAGLYAKAQKGAFDIYEQIKKPVFYLGEGLRRLHNGVLPTYLVWCLLGMVAFFFWSIR
jgi:hypothetical protein